MKNLSKTLLLFFLALASMTSFTACLDEDFDQPPTDGEDPGLTVTTTIKELKAMHAADQFETITEDLIIKGVVVADDASGNWYKAFVLQDETGGIEILTDLADSYVFYPVGREVYVKLKGLVLGDYNNLVQLGGYTFQGNGTELGPIIDISGHLLKSKLVGLPEPKVKTINQLNADDVSTLIRLEGVQFVKGDTASTFADQVHQEAYNLEIEDCAQRIMLVRTSGFASFAGSPIPNGGGSLTGVLGIYRDDLQLFFRDLDDVQLTGDRCTFNPCAGTTVVEVNTLNETFSSGAHNTDIDLNGWVNLPVVGSRLWRFREFQGNIYAQATAFQDSGNPQMESWLVTPAIKNDVDKLLSFESAQAYWTHDALSVWISTDFECDPATATWQPISCPLAKASDANFDWVESGEIDLSAVTGSRFFIGFKYVGSGPGGQTGNAIIDNLVIKNK
ncbi:MAG: DUF5689 domain-containing protein [Bacteroidota bacterium]